MDSISRDKDPGQSNSQFLFNFLVDRLATAFPNVSSSVTFEKVTNWFKTTEEKQF